jgi:hypothetical protein
MKVINKGLEPVLKSAIAESLQNYDRANEDSFLNDLYLYYDAENQTVTFFDDVERELFTVNLSDENVDWEIDSQRELQYTAKAVLKELEASDVFKREFIHKPFTASLIDSDFIVMEELIYIDDDTLKLEEDLWMEVDKELDDFLKNLMK